MSGDGPKLGPDYFGFFTHELNHLLSGEDGVVDDDDLLPILGFKSDVDENETETDENGVGLEKMSSLFSDGLGGELLDYRKERLKLLLKQSVSVLTQEVDQMVEAVLSMFQLRNQLRSKTTASSSQGSLSDYIDRARPCSKRKKSKYAKVSATSAPVECPFKSEPMEKDSLERSNKFKSLTDILSQNGEFCVNCNVSRTSQWRNTPDGSRICNACGLRLRKEGLHLSPHKKDLTIGGSQPEADNNKEEVTDDVKFLLDNDRLAVEQMMTKYADELSSSLGHMGQQLEGFLDNITSKCRNMTFFEKQGLWKLIKALPPKNFDRVVEIIKRSRGLDQLDENEMLIDLEDMDNKVLWRLYYYAKAVENVQKALGIDLQLQNG